jgi:hypothetical protein
MATRTRREFPMEIRKIISQKEEWVINSEYLHEEREEGTGNILNKSNNKQT